MKRLLLAIGLVLVALLGGREAGFIQGLTPERASTGSGADAVLQAALASRASDLQVAGSGEVVKILSDDNQGSRHQRFILRTASGQTVLIAHNIDVAKRVAGLKVGDRIEFNGEYEWNDRGGVIHWTHHDPQARHASGWLKHEGRTYQ